VKRTVAIAALAIACTKKTPPPPEPVVDAAVASARPAPSASASTAIAADAAAPAAERPQTLAEILEEAKPPVPDENRVEPVVRIDTAKGALVLWTLPDGDKTMIVAALGSGSTKIIRRTSGEVTELRAVERSDGELAIAWSSRLTDGHVAAVTFASADLARLSSPIQLALGGTMDGHVALVKSPRGGVVVAYAGPPAKCAFMGHSETCVTGEVKAISADGTSEILGTIKVDGGASPDLWLVPLETRGVLAYVSSMRGGRTITSSTLPWSTKETAITFEAPTCGGLAGIVPDILRGSAGEVVCLDIDARYGAKLEHCLHAVKDDRERCLRIGVSGTDGTPITPKNAWDTPVTRIDCVGKNARLSFPGGTVTLATPSSHLGDFMKNTCK